MELESVSRDTRGRPSTLTFEEFTARIEAERAYGRKYYHDHKQLKTKAQCTFVNARTGKQCTKTTYRGLCARHISKQ